MKHVRLHTRFDKKNLTYLVFCFSCSHIWDRYDAGGDVGDDAADTEENLGEAFRCLVDTRTLKGGSDLSGDLVP